MNSPPRRIYLDNAATSWPKPEAVYRAVDDFQRRLGAPAGRSGYREAAEVERGVAAARLAVARLLNASEPERVIFTANGTDSLNLAIRGVLRAGDHVVTTAAEHNSVLRPLRALEREREIAVTRVPLDGEGRVDPDALRSAVTPRTRLLALTSASNVTGTLQPLREASHIARESGALFLVDAAQAVGHIPLDVRDPPVDLLAAPGHKGLLGPLGTGILYVAPGIERQLDSIRQGGTGSRSDEDVQPDLLPDKYESGNLNVLGILGLGAGVEYLAQRTVVDVQRHEQELTGRFLAGMDALPAIRVHGTRDLSGRVGVVSVTIEGYDPQEAAAALDAAHGIQVRPGLHCAPLMHKALGTIQGGGTVRFSIGPFNTEEDIDAALSALRELTHA